VLRRGPITLEIAVLATMISWMIGFPVGIISTLRPNTWMDHAGRMFSILFVAIPGFWLGLVAVLTLILWFDYKAPILPIYPWENPWKNLQMVAGPALVLGLGFAGSWRAWSAHLSSKSYRKITSGRRGPRACTSNWSLSDTHFAMRYSR
jgi:peptide/nickel transport system permease protein